MPQPPTVPARRVVIAGGGVAAVEALLALRALPGGPALDVTVVAPAGELVYKPLAVGEPFGRPPMRRYRLDAICADLGATLVHDVLGAVEAERRIARCGDGRELPYDALVVATGASAHAALPSATTFFADRGGDAGDFHWVVREVEEGITRSIAFVVPPGSCWPLPLYELALLTAQRAWAVGAVDTAFTLLTPEDVPLAAFRGAGSEAVARLLAEAGIAVETAVYAHDYDGRTLALTPGDRRLAIDRVVALPALRGPAIDGLPSDRDGFVRIDGRCRVPGCDGVYAVGDATTFPLKQGGIATQQADAVAAQIAGRDAELRPHLRAILVTGRDPLYLAATVAGGVSVTSSASQACPWWPPHKIAARHLAPYLADREQAAA